ncbi:transcriptional regulator [Lactobacillus sp. CBA3605]|uniref:helix-turn-helix domain-containing protein n=1 Tax=Lactobacillus sp. CBA3605 TaxID=2099788 RepID=UPI000CFCBFE3|nr:helix-turn-helix transcriptional regulator [Lactobacillus sp. CBA3605]AVK60562.1 transcriptional regulator [Lactobacillus sp. CBA3605]
MTLFERVKKIAKKNGFSLAEVARQANIGEKSIYTWKPSKTYPNGVNPSRDVLDKVADVLSVSTDYLLGKTDDENIESDPKHIDVDDIVNNSAMLTSRDHALSDEDRAAISALVSTYLNSKEGQDRLRKYGGYDNEGNKTEKRSD